MDYINCILRSGHFSKCSDEEVWPQQALQKNKPISTGHRSANRPAFSVTVPFFYQMSHVLLNHGNVPLFCTNSEKRVSLKLCTKSKCDARSPHSLNTIECDLRTAIQFPVKIESRDITSIMYLCKNNYQCLQIWQTCPASCFWQCSSTFVLELAL